MGDKKVYYTSAFHNGIKIYFWELPMEKKYNIFRKKRYIIVLFWKKKKLSHSKPYMSVIRF